MLRKVKVVELVPAKNYAADVTGTGVDISTLINPGGKEMQFFLSVGAKSGTSPTLNVKIQESDDDSTYTDVSDGAFTEATDVTTENIYAKVTKKYIRAYGPLGGTSPTFDFCVVALGVRRLSE
jgi:hypothetical protein